MVLGRIGLTGASGMVGRHLLALMARKGIACRATSRTPPTQAVDWVGADMADWRSPADLDAVFTGVDAVVHVAAMIPDGETDAAALIDVNLRATMVLGQWALARSLPLVFVSSCSVYGETLSRLDETTPLGAVPLGGLYGLSKAWAEQALGHLSGLGLGLTILRPTAVYGWGMPTGKLVAAWAARALRGETIELAPPFGDSVNLLHAHDLARAVLAVLEAGATGTFNIRGPDETSMVGLAEACVRVSGKGRVARRGEDDAARPALSRFLVDGGAARRVFGYGPLIGLDQGLALLNAQALLPATGVS